MFNYIDTLPAGTLPAGTVAPGLMTRALSRASGLKLARHTSTVLCSDGPMLASESIYESMTSSCGVTGQPLTTTTLGFYT